MITGSPIAASLRRQPRRSFDIGGCERVSILAWALLSGCARARAKSHAPIASMSWRPQLRRRARYPALAKFNPPRPSSSLDSP
jgi:hypothetical protein